MNPFNRISSFSRSFGNGMINSLPISYLIHTNGVKDQGKDTDKCSFYAIASCFEPLVNTEIVPDRTYNLAKTKQNKTGFELGWACSFACENGFTDTLGNDIKNQYIKPYKVDGSHDVFDNIRTALDITKLPIVSSAYWKPEWTFAANGVVQDSINKGGEPHAFCVIGWNENNLVIQNSKGKKVGDKGLFYFDRYLVNKYFLDSFCFKEVAEKDTFTLAVFKKIVSSLLKCYNTRHEPSHS